MRYGKYLLNHKQSSTQRPFRGCFRAPRGRFGGFSLQNFYRGAIIGYIYGSLVYTYLIGRPKNHRTNAGNYGFYLGRLLEVGFI